jgi:uncharacterized SAM-binding protein YcdF (DUF218 family)
VAAPLSVRLVAVLGYSGRRHHGLHDVCAERLRHAEQLAGDGDTVLLSGRARHRNGTGEVELMRAAWNGPEVTLVSDSTARTTRENAAEVAETARRLGAEEVVVVTSHWHAPRARALVRAALRQPSVSVESSSPPGRKPVALLARELICFGALPYDLARLRRRTR